MNQMTLSVNIQNSKRNDQDLLVLSVYEDIQIFLADGKQRVEIKEIEILKADILTVKTRDSKPSLYKLTPKQQGVGRIPDTTPKIQADGSVKFKLPPKIPSSMHAGCYAFRLTSDDDRKGYSEIFQVNKAEGNAIF